MLETLELETLDSTDAAFLSAVRPKIFDGIELKPFSLMRQCISLSLGVTDSIKDRMSDAILIIWLCTLEEREAVDTLKDPVQAKIDAHAFAAAHKVSLYNYKPLIAVYKEITEEIAASASAVQDNDGTEPKNVGGQPVS